MRAQKGQSTVEYILLVTAVIGVIILFTSNGGPFQTGLNSVFNSTTQDMLNVSTYLQDNAAN
jgi:Flp pilus assembly pilin Flp